MWRTAESPRITVADFFEAGRATLQLAWEANPEAAVGREITEVALNRPGLALAGFLRYFDITFHFYPSSHTEASICWLIDSTSASLSFSNFCPRSL